MIGRIGGEEFGIILPGVSAHDASRLIDQVRESFGRLVHKMEGAEISATFSCGISDIAHNKSATDLNAAADAALYEAKKNGRDQVRLAN